MLVVLGAMPAAADEWLRIEWPTSEQALWVDLEARRYGWIGLCDGGRSLERLNRDEDRLEFELSELLQAELGQGQLAIEQRLLVKIQGDSGTLHVRSPQAGDLVVVPLRVTWSRRRSPPGCGN